MAEELVMEHPHVHEWRHHHDNRIYHGPVRGLNVPPVVCECGEGAGDWADVSVVVLVDALLNVKVADVWTEGDHPVPVTAEAVAAALAKAGPRALDELGLDYEVIRGVSVGLGRRSVPVTFR